MSLRIGIDTGGTFTDLVALDDTGAARIIKVVTTADDPSVGVLRAISEATDAFRLDLGDVAMLVQGSTIAINTLVQRSGAKVGLLVTRGFRDVLELGRLRLARVNDLYVERPAPLVPRGLVREVDERLDARGNVLREPDDDDVMAAVAELREEGVDALAISFLHSFRNPVHERRVAAAVRTAHPELFVTTSAELWPVRGEYERTVVAAINAYVGERMATFVEAVAVGASDRGIDGSLLTTKSNGGVMDAGGAARRPVETLLSGPAAGVVAAHRTARARGWSSALSFDMGGTTADVAIITGGIPYSYESAAGDFQIVVPSVDVHAIGAGGGSIVSRDQAGVLKVGPASAGSSPGPACYGLGGVHPTVTDAYVALGMIPDGSVLGGWVTVHRDLAAAALERLSVKPQAVLDVATSTMTAQLMPLAAAGGVDVAGMPLIAYGGAGPTQGCLLARAIGAKTVLVPPMPGTMCALGAILADLRVDFVRSLSVACDPAGVSDLRAAASELEREARAWLGEQRAAVASTSLVLSADMRYRGQSFEISVALPEDVSGLTAPGLHHGFCQRYEGVYGRSDAERRSEIVALRLQMVGHIDHPAPRRVVSHTVRATAEKRSSFPLLDRSEMIHGVTYSGPAVIIQYDTTVFLPVGSEARLDQFHNIEITV